MLRMTTVVMLALIVETGLAQAQGTGGDIFNVNPGRKGSPPQTPAPGGDYYSDDTECGGTDRRVYDNFYHTKGVVIDQNDLRRMQQENPTFEFHCSACKGKVICWMVPLGPPPNVSPALPQLPGRVTQCAQRPAWRGGPSGRRPGQSRQGNIAKGYVTNYAECKSITLCLTADLNVGTARYLAGSSVTFDLSYAHVAPEISGGSGTRQRVNVPFLVEDTGTLSATDVIIDPAPRAATAPKPARDSAKASSGCSEGDQATPKQPPKTQGADQSPCPRSTLGQTASGPPRRLAPRRELTRAEIEHELETIRADLDRFWQEQFTAHNMLLYSSPNRFAQCRERDCFYQPPDSKDRNGIILYNADLISELWKRYGRVIVVEIMAHEFGHNAELKAKGQFSEDPQRELLADRLAGAYIAYLHHKGVVVGDQPFGVAGMQGSPCPDDDIRAIRAALTEAGDPRLGLIFEYGFMHKVGKVLGAPDFHGSGAERWTAFWRGYTTGIPSELFSPPWKNR